jgi:hypothetical protein
VAQRRHRVDFRSSARWYPAGYPSQEYDKPGREQKVLGISTLQPNQDAAKHRHDEDRQTEADYQSHSHSQKSLAKY